MFIIAVRDIRAQRQTLGASAQKLALDAGISQGRLSYLERGVVQPHDGELRRVQKAMERIGECRLTEMGYSPTKFAEHARRLSGEGIAS